MIREVKAYKAGFVRSDSNLSPEMTLADVLELKEKTGHSTMPVTVDGTPNSRLVGIVTSRDYRVSRMDPSTKVSEFMTPREKLICGPANCTLSEANDIIWDNKLKLPAHRRRRGSSGVPGVPQGLRLPQGQPQRAARHPQALHRGARASTRATTPSACPCCSRPAPMPCASTPPRATRCGRSAPSTGSATTTATRVIVGRRQRHQRRGLPLSSPRRAPTSSRWASAAGSICITREQKGIGRGQATALIEVCREARQVLRGDGRLRAGVL